MDTRRNRDCFSDSSRIFVGTGKAPITASMPATLPKLPARPWQLASAVLYAFAGGYGDAAGYLLGKTFTGHVTGNLVLLAIALCGARPAEILLRVAAVLCFLAATACGLFFSAWKRSRAAVLAFAVQSTLLLAAAAPPVRHSPHAVLLQIAALCCALGLANGIIHEAGGVGFHPTFLSGDFTTLMAAWVHAMRPADTTMPHKPAAAPILLPVIGSFFLGALAARLLRGALGPWLPLLLLPPLCAAGLAAGRSASLFGADHEGNA